MEQPKLTKPCAHCRAELAPKDIHWDHIPPKNLFPKGTEGIIQVPACRKCNNPDSKDDEYFRLLALSIAADNNPSARQANDLNHRAITRPGARKFRQALARKSKPVIFRTPMGLIAGPGSSIEMDGLRLNRTVSKITRGIYYDIMKRPVPEGHIVDPLRLFDVDEVYVAQLRHQLRDLPVFEIGEKTFQFRFGYIEEIPGTAILLMRVYEWAEFIAIVRPDEAPKNQTA